MRSLTFRRIIILVFVSVLLCALLVYGIFTIIADQEFTNIRAKELLPRAEHIALSYASFYESKDEQSQENFLQTFYDADDSAWGGKLRIYEVSTERFLKPENPNTETEKKSALDFQALMPERTIGPSYIMPSLNYNPYDYSGFPQISEAELKSVLMDPSVLDVILSGKNLIKSTNNDYLIVGVPIYSNSNIIGGVFFAKPLTELSAALTGLNRTLLLSLQVIAVLMLIPCLLVARRISLPINQIRDTALMIAKGNFGVQASIKTKGEIGDLADSINYLSSKLRETVSDLVVERNRLKRIIDGLGEGIISVDIELRPTHHNNAACSLFNSPAPESLPSNVNYYYSGLSDDFSKCINDNETINKNVALNNRILSIIINPLFGDNYVIVGAVALIQDITESERLEQTRRDYVANVSHELKTPIASIRAMAETLNDNLLKSDEQKAKYYNNIVKESYRLSRLINDLLELSRLQSNVEAIENDIFDIRDFISDAMLPISNLAEDMDIDLKLDIAPDVHIGYGNIGRLSQILIIILDNAIKYSAPEDTIVLSATRENKSIRISVKDNGPGINPEDLEHIFDRFYKVDKAHTISGTSGFGLGLSIAKQLTDNLGESIGATSTVGEGSTFYFTITNGEYID